jgi:hypothetical protein
MWVTAYARSDGGPVIRVDTSSVTYVPPIGDTIHVEFDGETNAALQADLVTNTAVYTITNSVLWKGGRAAPISAPGIHAADLKVRADIVEKLRIDSPLTEAEVRVVLRYLLGLS